MRRTSTTSFQSKDGSLPSRKESLNLAAFQISAYSKSSTQRVKSKKIEINEDEEGNDDSLSSKSEHEWMAEQEKREVRKHNVMKKNRLDLKIQK